MAEDRTGQFTAELSTREAYEEETMEEDYEEEARYGGG